MVWVFSSSAFFPARQLLLTTCANHAGDLNKSSNLTCLKCCTVVLQQKMGITASLHQLMPGEIFTDSLSNILCMHDLSSLPGFDALDQCFLRLKLLKIPSYVLPVEKCSGTEHLAACWCMAHSSSWGSVWGDEAPGLQTHPGLSECSWPGQESALHGMCWL